MKKVLVLLLCIILVGCGKSSKKEEEKERKDLVKNTPVLKLKDLWKELDANEPYALQTYEGKNFKIKVKFQNKGKDYFEYKEVYNGKERSLKVYMKSSDMKKLKESDEITVLGKLTNITTNPGLLDAFVTDDYVEVANYSKNDLKEKIKEFGKKDVDGSIYWDLGSYPFFIDNRLKFEELTEEDFNNELIGTWIGRHYSDGDKSYYNITFEPNGKSYVDKNGTEKFEWSYAFTDDLLNFPKFNTADDYEIRRVAEDFYAFYSDNKPRWIIYGEQYK